MTDTKPKDVCDTIDYGHAHEGMSVCVCVCVFTKVAESVRGVPFQLRHDDLRAIACIQCRVPRFNFRLSDWGRIVPRIGVCRACHGSGRAVPTVPFTTGPDTRRLVKNLVDPSTSVQCCFSNISLDHTFCSKDKAAIQKFY